jgi:predicted Zn-dependent peptidase
MKKITLSIAALALFTAARAQSLDRSVRPKPGPAPTISLGKTESFTLPNGMKVFVVENHKLPTVAYSIQLDIRPELEGSTAGVSELMGELLTSGTTTRSSEKLAQEIDQIGARIDASEDGLFGSALKRHQTKLLELMGDIAANTKFTAAELDKTKKRAISGLQAEKNEPDAMLRNVSAVVNYGKSHPYGEVATDETVERINLGHVNKYYSTYFRPNVAYMAVVGDITMAEVKPLIEKYFAGWKKADVPRANYTKPAAPTKTDVVFVPREGAVQSVINVTYPVELQPGTPDVVKAQVANAVLGNGSQGRLFLNLREAHGWTYGSYSTVAPDDLMGNFTAYAKCRNAVSDSSVAEIINEMRRMNNEKVSAEELQARIAYMSGNFAIGLEDPQKIAQYAINIERYKMPKDYYQNYLKNLAAVSAEDVQQAAHTYLNPDNAHVVVVGDKETVAKKLARFSATNTVAYVDNFGREVKMTETAAAPVGLKGDDVLKKYVKAIGGESALTSIKSIRTISETELPGMGTLTMTEVRKAPGQMKFVVAMGGNPMQTMVWNGKSGYQNQMGQKKDLEGAELAEFRLRADIQAALHPETYGIKREVKGQDGNLVLVEATGASGKPEKEYYDATSGLLVKKVQTQESEQGPITSITEFADYREVPGTNGYKIPYSLTMTGVAPMPITMKVKTIEVNKTIEESEFQ